MTPKDSHMKVLEDCHCGAHLYLSLRERKKALSLYLVHVTRGSKGVQNMVLLSKISRTALEFHGPGQEEAGDIGAFKQIVLEHVKEEIAYLTNLEKRQKPSTARGKTVPLSTKDIPLLSKRLKKKGQSVLPL